MIVAGHFSRCPLRACARAAADAATGIPATTSEYFTGRPLTVRARLTDVRRDGLAQIRWSSEQVSLADQAQRMDLGQMLCHSRAAPHVVPTIIATLINRLTKSDIPCSKGQRQEPARKISKAFAKQTEPQNSHGMQNHSTQNTRLCMLVFKLPSALLVTQGSPCH